MPQQNRVPNYDKKAKERTELCLNVRFYDNERLENIKNNI